MHPRRFARVRPTGRISDVAILIVDPKAPVVDCRVVDYSPGSACLEIREQTTLPGRFELLFGGTKKHCRVVWSAGRRLGGRVLAHDRASGVRGPGSEFSPLAIDARRLALVGLRYGRFLNQRNREPADQAFGAPVDLGLSSEL